MDRDQLDISDTAQCIVNAKASVKLLLDFAASVEQQHMLRTLIHQAYLEGFEDGGLWREAEQHQLTVSYDSRIAGAAMWPQSQTYAVLGSATD